jgi:hypothetical protein
MNNEIEIWKDIPGYEGLYQCSSLGRVKSVSRFLFNGHAYYKSKEIILKPHKDRKGYFQVALHKNGQKTFMVHKLIAFSFLDHTPCKMEKVINHINSITTDNRVINLEITTNRRNISIGKNLNKNNYTGTTFDNGKWKASICINKKHINLGRFETEIEAHLAYQNKLKSIENE